MTDSAEPATTAPAPPVVGMVGGGQLARMTSPAATGLGIGFRVLADTATDSAAQVVAGTRLGDYRSLADLRDFAAGCDVLTFDHEHVPGPHLAALVQDGVTVRPDGAALRFTQDKLAMRERLTEMSIACPRFAPVRTAAEVEAFADGAWPLVLKAVSGDPQSEFLRLRRPPGGQARRGRYHLTADAIPLDRLHHRVHRTLPVRRARRENRELAIERDVLLRDQVDPVGEHARGVGHRVAHPHALTVVAAPDCLEHHRPRTSREFLDLGDLAYWREPGTGDAQPGQPLSHRELVLGEAQRPQIGRAHV